MLIIQPSSQQKGTIIKQEGKQIRQVTSLNAVRRGEGNPQKGGCENPKWAAAVLKTLREPLTRALKKRGRKEKRVESLYVWAPFWPPPNPVPREVMPT